MPYQNLDDGLYLVRQNGDKNGISVLHYGVLDIGNKINLMHPQIVLGEPMIIHQTPPQVRADQISKTGNWELLGKVDPGLEQDAIGRINNALKTPHYDLFGHNCEHFARFVTTGLKESKQLQNVAWAVVGVITLGWALTRKA